MSKTQRNITVALWCLVVVSLLGLLVLNQLSARAEARRTEQRQLQDAGIILEPVDGKITLPTTLLPRPVGYEAPAFKLVTQDGVPFDAQQLRGKVWTASFFFSFCEGICPSMLEKVQGLAKVTTDPNVKFVYFSVDPERDTPDRLKAYATEANADPTRWHMLTGPAEEMRRIGAAFHLPYRSPAEHSGKIVLVDQQGVVRGYYEQSDSEEMLKLSADIQKLLAGKDLQ
jgi:protein SCO1